MITTPGHPRCAAWTATAWSSTGPSRATTARARPRRGARTSAPRRERPSARPQRRRGLQGRRRDGREPHRLQLPRRRGGGGNQIWFNGGDGSGTDRHGTASAAPTCRRPASFYGGPDAPAGTLRDLRLQLPGPGRDRRTPTRATWTTPAYYVGACPDCNTVLTDAHAQYSALGYSGTNSGGHLRDRALRVGPQQDRHRHQQPEQRRRPVAAGRLVPAAARAPSCTFFRDNYIHDNNNPNVPGAGTRRARPGRDRHGASPAAATTRSPTTGSTTTAPGAS